jgi:hypothetical protein
MNFDWIRTQEELVNKANALREKARLLEEEAKAVLHKAQTVEDHGIRRYIAFGIFGIAVIAMVIAAIL